MSVAVAAPVAEQFARLQEVYPESTIVGRPDGTTLVTVPGVALPTGWSQSVTIVRFVVPVGYPMARPDCFWADAELRLVGGRMPQNAGVNAIPGTTAAHLWFSWHPSAWNPATDSLLTYVRVIERRLADPR